MINLSFLYLANKKKKLYLSGEIFFYIIMKCFYNNWGIPAFIIYFCFVFVDLINDCKNIYFHNVCEMIFMCINTFERLLLV